MDNIKYILLLFSMTLGVIGQFLLKKGVTASSLSPNLHSIIQTLFSPMVFAGLTFYGFSAVVWLFVLQKFPLSVAYPSLALTYIAIVILSYFFLKEPITTAKIVGVVLIFAGVYFLYK